MDIYTLTSGNFISQLNSVDNEFVRRLYMLAVNSAKEKKMLSILLNLNKGDAVSKALNEVDSNSVLNMCNLPALIDKEHCKNIVEDIAKYRWGKLDFNYDEDYWKERSSLLFIDYILSSALCYVEVFETTNKGTSKVDKFYATRNRFIAANTAQIDAGETGRYVNYLTPVLADYKMENLRVLKLSRQKKGFKITQPRSAINFSKSVKIVPIFFINAFLQGIVPLLKSKILKFDYVKDNGQIRELITTLSSDILSKYYDINYAQTVLKGAEMKIDRGYLKVPELGCSKYDDTGLRALNISRIVGINEVDTIDTSYIDVDFKSIIPTFKGTLESISQVDIMKVLYQAILNDNPGEKTLAEMRSDIFMFVDGRFAIGTTTYQKELHKFMLNYSMIFKGYNGKPNAYTLEANLNGSFDLGFE